MRVLARFLQSPGTASRLEVLGPIRSHTAMTIPRRRLRWLRRLILGCAALVLLWLGLSALAAWRLTRRSGPIEVERIPEMDGATIEALRLRTSDGQDLGAWLVRAEGPGARPVAVLYLHGNGASRSRGLRMIRFLHESGYTVLAPSLRAHGDSTGDANDFGFGARLDVVAAGELLRERLPAKRIAVVAQSLGAAAAIFAAGDVAPQVSAYFLESPYTDLSAAVWNRCDRYLPPILSHLAWAGLRLWAPAFLPVEAERIRPLDHIARIPERVPVTLIGGSEDRHCRPAELEAHFARVRSHATLVLIPGGEHATLQRTHPAEYNGALRSLLEKVQ